jgi:hypothetical protein
MYDLHSTGYGSLSGTTLIEGASRENRCWELNRRRRCSLSYTQEAPSLKTRGLIPTNVGATMAKTLNTLCTSSTMAAPYRIASLACCIDDMTPTQTKEGMPFPDSARQDLSWCCVSDSLRGVGIVQP